MECHKCPDYMKHQGEAWETTPCAKCQLRDDSYGTLPYVESCTANSSLDHNPDDETWDQEVADSQSPQPYAVLDGENPEDPRVPLSALVSAMSLFLSLSAQARKALQLRMLRVSYTQCGLRMGCTRQAVEKLVAQALAKQPLLQNLLPAKTARAPTPLSGSRTSAISDYGKSGKRLVTASRKPAFVPISETRTA